MMPMLSRNWWILLLRGILGILLGTFAFISPLAALYALVLFFGAYALVDGIGALTLGFFNQEDRTLGWPMAVVGTLGIASGIIALMWPGISLIALLFLVATWLIVKGVFEIAAAIRLRKVIEHEWLLLAAGIFSILFGSLLIARPGIGLVALAWTAACYAMVFGILMVTLSLKLREYRTETTGYRQAAY